VLTILGGLAAFERSLIAHGPTRDAKARENKVTFGRPRAQPAAEAARRGQVRRGETMRALAEHFGVSERRYGGRCTSGIVRRLLALALALLISNALETSAWARGHGGGHGGPTTGTSHSTAHHSLNWRIRTCSSRSVSLRDGPGSSFTVLY